MYLIDQLAEQHIQAALERGELNGLEGSGRPLELDDDSLVAEHLRAGYRLLKNAGYLPPEVAWRQEIASVEQLLMLAHSQADRERLSRRLTCLLHRLELAGHAPDLTLATGYGNRLDAGMAGRTTGMKATSEGTQA